MLTIKNRGGSDLAGARKNGTLSSSNVATLIFLMVLLAGCTPSGPRALLQGKRLLDEGKYPQAIEKLSMANGLLGGTNALVWNYLGLAYHQAERAAEAERAYQKALVIDHDLSEARYNLGCLLLGQNRLEAAKAEFTACTMRRPNVVEGFLKLGAVQLRTRDPGAAEKSFSDALRLSSHNPEALNGLGLARLQRGRASEAAQCFDEALKQQPDYRPALLNLAIVSHQYLKDHRLALEKYHEYLALKPPPDNADALMATVQQLEQELNPQARHAATSETAQPALRVNPPKPAVTNVTRIASAIKAEPPPIPPKSSPTNVAKPESAAHVPKAAPTNVIAPPANTEVVRLPAEPVIKRAQDISAAPTTIPATAAEPLITTSSVPASVAGPTIARRGFFQRVNPLNLLRSGEKTPVRPTPLAAAKPSPEGETASSAPNGAELTASVPSPRANGPATSYAYKSRPQPVPGNRSEAESAFAQGVQAYEAQRLPQAVQAYRLAARLDPSYFEAYYNLGLVDTKIGNLPAALAAYEDALAVDPTSLEARYNFALVLKQANYIADAVKEFERVLVSYPNETRAHLSLGNLYAQQLHQPAKARPHYVKVLEGEPRHPQARDIRYWLAANPP
jgi:tetratricopeptide (TPR) repeat protein